MYNINSVHTTQHLPQKNRLLIHDFGISFNWREDVNTYMDSKLCISTMTERPACHVDYCVTH